MAKFKLDERVMARWPSSSLWFEGTVVDFNDIEYLIRFDDPGKSEYIIKSRDVKSLMGFRRRSKSRGRSRSRGRPAGRGKSQNRSSRSEPEQEPVPEPINILETEPVILPRNNTPEPVNIARLSRATPEPVTIAHLSRATPEPVTITRLSRATPEPVTIARLSRATPEPVTIARLSRATPEPVTIARLSRATPEPVTIARLSRATPEPVPIARLSRADAFFAPRTSTPSSESALIATMNDKNEIDGQVNNVETVTTSEEVAPTSHGSRLCGLTCSIGSYIKSGISAIVPSLATLKAVPAIVIMISLPFIFTEMCTKNKCTVMDFPAIPRKLQYYYDPFAIAVVAGVLVSQLLLYLLPIGRVVKTHNGATVYNNGFIVLLLSLAVVPIMSYLEYDVLAVYVKYRQLQATSIILAVILAVAMYIRAGYIPDDAKNPVGNSGIVLPDFYIGREIAPVIGSVDLKFFVFRTSLCFWIMINVIVIMKDLHENSGQYSPTLLLACILQIFYAGDFLWFEEAYITTYDYMNHGFGFLYLLGAFAGPFFLTVFTRLVLNHRTELEWYYLSFIAALNLMGYTILRGSNSQKHAFRSHPSNPALAHLESLPTPAGKRLLVSGWWGVMRHPNYFGDILIFTSWSLLCGFNHALPWILLFLDALFLVGRIFETENVCKKKYGTAWDSYTERVKYRLIPKVF